MSTFTEEQSSVHVQFNSLTHPYSLTSLHTTISHTVSGYVQLQAAALGGSHCDCQEAQTSLCGCNQSCHDRSSCLCRVDLPSSSCVVKAVANAATNLVIVLSRANVVQFQLTINLVALVVAFVAAVTTGEMPLNVLQLLWVNLIMDALAALGMYCRTRFLW